MEDISTQSEEIEALCSIYGSEWVCEDEANRNYRICINEGGHELQFYVTLTLDYPSKSPPHFEISAPSLNRQQKQIIGLALDDIYLDSIGEPIIYQWIEKIRELLLSFSSNEELTEPLKDDDYKEILPLSPMNCPNIIHGKLIQDRRSTFQGHTARVNSKEEIQLVLNCLKENKKISQATHNMFAYRIKDKDTDTLLQDCDDDGESHAGKRLLHLLNIVNVHNVIVVVTRWYGGIHLGPDRFRHISNAARQVLDNAGLITKR